MIETSNVSTSQAVEMNNNLNVNTFFDSSEWGVFYGYNQIIIVLTILISSYFLAKDIKLDYKCYQFLKDIYSKVGYIYIAIDGLQRKSKHKDNTNITTTHSHSNHNVNVQNITFEMVMNLIDVKCDEMILLVENIRNYFKNKVIIIATKDNSTAAKHYSKTISLSYGGNVTGQNTRTGDDAGLVHNDKLNKIETATSPLRLAILSSANDETKAKEIMLSDDLELELNLELELEDENVTKQEEKQTSSINASLDNVITEYVSHEIDKYDLNKNKKDGFKKFLKILWDIRKIMFMVFSHVFDTASDVALAIEWYILYQRQLNDENYFDPYDIDMTAMFWCCISIILYYRTSSSWEIYNFSHSFVDVFFQFFFDFYLIKLIYINVFKMKSYSPMKILKIMRSIEGQNESGFQSILTMVFLIKTNFWEFGNGDGSSGVIAIFSFIFSFLSLTSRFIFLDFHNLQPNAQTFGINVNDIHCRDINVWYVFHLIFRLIEVLFSVLMFSLIWVVFGGIWLVVVVAGLYLWLALRSKLLGFGFVMVQSNFWGRLLVFDIRQILVVFNFEGYHPYSILSSRTARLLLFLLLGCWLLFARVLLCCMFATMYNHNSNNINSDDDTTVLCIIISIILIFIWLWMFVLAIKFYINRDDTIRAHTASNELNGIDIIKSNDQESILFCKELGIDVFRHKNYKKYHTSANMANNVLDAMIISNDIDNYLIIEEWYYNIGMKQKIGYDFVDFIKNSLEWNVHTIQKLLLNCDSLDYYKLIHDKLGLNLSLVDSKFNRNILHNAVWYEPNVEIIEWILTNKIIDDINAVNVNGRTCLHFLMDYIYCDSNKRNKSDLLNERKIAQLFISHGVDPSIESKEGKTAKEYLEEIQDEFYDWLVDDDEQ